AFTYLDLFAQGWLTLGPLAVAHANSRGRNVGWFKGLALLAARIPLQAVAGAGLPLGLGLAARSGGRLAWSCGAAGRTLSGAAGAIRACSRPNLNSSRHLTYNWHRLKI
ncbi:MAG: hypothetical protein ACLFWD_03445, partial [Anaerolineales bacterium]